MPKKIITDWDAYFEHRQQVQYLAWLRWYNRHVEEARDKEQVFEFFSLLVLQIA